MPGALRVDKLTLEAFRGVRQTACLDFEGGKASIALFGNNGDGKSCFADAVEWVLTDDLELFSREGCGREDFFHVERPDAPPTVTLDLVNAPVSKVQRKLPLKGRSQLHPQGTAEPLVAALAADNLILRQDALRRFVDFTKAQKLQALEKLLGYDRVGEARNALNQSVNALESDRRLTGLQAQEQMLWQDLSALGMAQFSESEVLRVGRARLDILGYGSPVGDVTALRTAAQEMTSRSTVSKREKQISDLTQLEQHFGDLASLEVTQAALDTWAKKLDAIRAQRALAEASILQKLYEAGLEVLEKELGALDCCPLCLQPADREALKVRLQREVASISAALAEWQGLQKDAQPILTQLGRESQAVVDVVAGLGTQWTWMAGDSTMLTATQKVLANERALADQATRSFPAAPVAWPDCAPIRQFVRRLKVLGEEVRKRRDSLAVTKEEKQRFQALLDLSKLLATYEKLLPIRREIEVFASQLRSLKKVLEAIEQVERAALEQLLQAISQDVDSLYSALHPGEHIADIKLVQTPDRGIEFEVKFCSKDVSPPRRTLSEAHLNCLGICLFLAVARRFMNTSGFIVLDDVVSSIDANHRRRLARVLKDEFGDVQFLLMTHDDLWFEMLKGELPQAKWKFLETMPWTPEEGVRLQSSPASIREEIQRCLDQNDVDGAANKIRRLYEMRLREICEAIRSPIDFRSGLANERRNPSEWLNSVASHVKANQTLRGKRAKQIFDEARASTMIGNIGSHIQTFQAGGLKPGDVTLALEDLGNFVEMFRCSECGQQVSRGIDKTVKLAECACRALAI